MILNDEDLEYHRRKRSQNIDGNNSFLKRISFENFSSEVQMDTADVIIENAVMMNAGKLFNTAVEDTKIQKVVQKLINNLQNQNNLLVEQNNLLLEQNNHATPQVDKIYSLVNQINKKLTKSKKKKSKNLKKLIKIPFIGSVVGIIISWLILPFPFSLPTSLAFLAFITSLILEQEKK